jgi:argininosuccinate lyase
MKLWETGAEQHNASIAEQFTAGEDIALDVQLWKYDILGSLAHVQMLHHIGILSAKERHQLWRALSALLDESIELTTADEDVHTKLENLLVERVGEVGKKIHTARSRNDQVLVALRLYTKSRLLEITEALLPLITLCAQQAKQHEGQPMPGYTHSRSAMLSSVGLWMGSLSESLLEDLELLEAAYQLVDQNPLGAAAGYGVPLKLDRELTTRLLGFARTQNNALAVMNSRGKIEFAVLAALSCILLDLNRFVSDVILFSGEPFGFFTLPEEFTTGSSIMPHKRNPDVLELVRARSARVLGALTQHAWIIKGLTSGYHRDLQETKRPLFEALETTQACVTVLTMLLAGLKLNVKRLNAAVTPELFAVDEVLERVRAGVPLREAYRQVKEQIHRLPPRDPISALTARAHTGGPGNLQSAQLRERIERTREIWEARRQAFRQVQESLQKLEYLTE